MNRVIPDNEAAPDWRVDLLLSPDELISSLTSEVASVSHLNAFLLAVAIQQVVDDHIQSGLLIDRIGAYVGTTSFRGAVLTENLVATVGLAAHRVRSRWRGREGLVAWQQHVTDLVEHLAATVMASATSAQTPWRHGTGVVDAAARDGSADERTAALVRAVTAFAPALPPGLREKTPVLPSCFQTFDLGVEDVRELGERVATAIQPSNDPLVVVGVRTSGSYLAPLLTAVLRDRGFALVETITLRPGIPVLGGTASSVRAAVRRGARFIVTDDPPVSGSSLARVVEQLVRAGVPRPSVSLAYPRFIDTPADLPGLQGYSQVVLPWADWDVHRRLTPDAVRAELEAMFGDGIAVTFVELAGERRPRRAEAHVRAVFRVGYSEGPDPGDGSEPGDGSRHVAVQGVGIGYYGEHVVAVADALKSYSPVVHGLRDGLLYRDWIDDALRVDRARLGEDVLTGGLAAYVAERRDRLPAACDRSVALAGSRPVWEAAAVEVSQSFGRAWPIAQVLAVNPIVRRILHVPSPCVTDGAMELEHWFVGNDSGEPAQLRTVGFQRRAFWHHGLSSYDSAFDLAGAMTADLDVPSSSSLLERYAALTGDVVSPERWLLLRLAQLWGRRRCEPDSTATARAAAARALQAYFATVFLADVMPDRSDMAGAEPAPLCALDVDGVLESEHLGFPSLTMASAFALRALRMHGYRPVLATGRSLEEVRERCLAYGLVGGVAEYGSALYVSASDEVHDLVPPDVRQELAALRTRLSAVPGVVVDPRYRHGVRAWVNGSRGTRPLPAEVLASVAARTPNVRIVEGEGQTDFVAAAVDKGTGLGRLIAALVSHQDASTAPAIALAVGDTASDAPMLALARYRAVPAHASAMLHGDDLWRSPAPYQVGLGQAVDRFLGHRQVPGWRAREPIWAARPDRRLRTNSVRARVSRATGRRLAELGCEQCALPCPDRATQALLLLLSSTEAGRRGLPGRALRAIALAHER